MYESKSQVKKTNKPALAGKSSAHRIDRFKTSVAEVKKDKKKMSKSTEPKKRYYAAEGKGPLSK
jgi:hypothetical protein|tara:strand:- start:2513 stop:2704 length:192 start_codon:yes stop_codon:yes gene_type:complete